MSNHATVTGNLARDPELRFTQGGRAVCNGTIVSEYRYQQNNEWKSEPSFINFVIWGDAGANFAASASKGTTCTLAGRLSQRNWETDAGEKRSVIELIVAEPAINLRWAQAVVTKTNQSQGGTQSASRGASGGGGGYSEPVYGDEEPFVGPACI